MSRKTMAAVAIATVGVMGVAGTAVAATGGGSGNRYGEGTGRGIAAGSGAMLRDGSGGGWGLGVRGRMGGPRGQGAGGRGSGSATHASDIPPAVPGATISGEVAEMLTFMVQEEKLARDVYALAIDQYGDRVFVNIHRAESTHMAELQVLLDRYDVADPTVGAGAGEFRDAELTTLYASLSSQLSDNRAGAIDAGIAVETADIDDLEEALKLAAPSDVTTVLENLLAGSERHLAAFERNA
jgi:hypothetical protein